MKRLLPVCISGGSFLRGNMEEKCPCENCVCQAICKQKVFIDLILGCELVDTFTEDNENRARARERVRVVYKTLQPSRWKPFAIIKV